MFTLIYHLKKKNVNRLKENPGSPSDKIGTVSIGQYKVSPGVSIGQ